MITINREKAIIYGEHGSADYYISESGGLELTHEEDGGLTDAEFAEAQADIDNPTRGMRRAAR